MSVGTRVMQGSAVIGGEVVPAAARFTDVDPSTGEPIADVARCGADEVDAAVAAAAEAWRSWADTPVADRSRTIRRLGALVESHGEELAHLESLDTGKPLSQARTDAAVAARYFEYYAGVAEATHGDSIPLGPDAVAFTTREPWGVTAHITAWNYPMQIACRSIAPALAAGNTAVVKPAEEAPLTTLWIARLAREAGLPPGVLNVVPGFGEEAGAALASHPGVGHVSFTGSMEVARSVAAAAAANVVPVSLELGGKSPNVVFADADLDAAVPTVVNAVLQNAGQTCSAGSRLLVHEAVYREMVERVAERFADVTIGRGVDDPQLGPLISQEQQARALALVAQGADEGRIVSGGGIPAGMDGGYFVEPTLVDSVPADAAIAQVEVFAPVLVAIPFEDLDEAVAVANATEYGLIAGVWTSDVSTAFRFSRRVRAGQVYVNAYGVGGGVELPFGGFGHSGYGRQKGVEGYLAMTQTKTVAVRT